ncbi:MAG: SAM-dependent chlorinase/fluorinase [Anaerolineales bacterium]|nr:MAG: SAM-dependent chlorinase/fluorinase [Anaerolineales bacterium]
MPIITLTTDFGLADGYVGTMQGVILSIAPKATLVDLSHQVPAQDIRAGAFVLYQAVPFFPPDSIHLVVVDPGVGSQRRAVAIRTSQGTFVAPDNGVLSYVLAATDDYEAVSLTNPAYQMPQISTTFHGRDIFSPAAAHLANGTPMSELGPQAINLVRLPLSTPEFSPGGGLTAHVMHVDHFGNLILDVTADALEEEITLELAGHRIQGMSRTFADVAPGKLVAYVGSSRDHVEIAVRDGDAAQELGVSVGDQVLIHRIQ